jgi:hypothetical protein
MNRKQQQMLGEIFGIFARGSRALPTERVKSLTKGEQGYATGPKPEIVFGSQRQPDREGPWAHIVRECGMYFAEQRILFKVLGKKPVISLPSFEN